jgi:hypothetical protein
MLGFGKVSSLRSRKHHAVALLERLKQLDPESCVALKRVGKNAGKGKRAMKWLFHTRSALNEVILCPV